MDDWDDTTQGGSTDPLAQSEYARLEQRYSDAGYREGITDGKLSTLQRGFDEGFAASVSASRKMGALRGRANALLAIANAKADEGLANEVKDVISDLSRVKRSNILPVDEERLHHEKTEHGDVLDSNDAREMENLEDMLDGLGKKASEVREGELIILLEGRVRALEAVLL